MLKIEQNQNISVIPKYLLNHVFIINFNSNFDSINAKFLLDDFILCYDVKELNNNTYWVLTEIQARYIILD